MLPEDPTVVRDPATSPAARSTIAGRYELHEQIGRGGFGAVFRARDTLLQRDVAIKLLAAATTDQQRERFLREARATARLQHPHVVTIFDAGADATGLFLVLELVPGRSLAEVMRGGPLPPERVLRIVIQAAEALHAGHVLGIVHRDVKPANLLLMDGDRLKVADFGLARIADDSNLTVEGTVMGTPRYMAPEQLESRPVTPSTDLFALGIVTYQLLTGEMPFRGETISEVVAKIVRGNWERPSAEIVAAAPAMWAAVERVLQPDPSRRGTVGEFIALLRGSPVRRRMPRRLALALIPVMAVGAWLTWRHHERAEGPGLEARTMTPATITATPKADAIVGSRDAAKIAEALRGYQFTKESNLFTGSESSTRRISCSGRYAASDFISVVARAAGWPLVQDISVRASGRAAIPIEGTDTPWDEVVRNVITAADLNVWRVGDVWVLESQQRRRERERTLPLQWIAFRLRRRDTNTVIAALQPLLSERGVAAVVAPHPEVIVCDTADRIAAMKPVVMQLDPERPSETNAEPSPDRYAGAPMSLNLRDADLVDVIRTFGKTTGASFVIDPGVGGKIAIDFQGVRWDNALDAILASQGLTWMREGQVLRIMPEAARFRGPTVIETLRMSRSKPTHFRAFEKALRPGLEIVVADDVSGTLVLRGKEQSVKAAAAVFRKIDGQAPEPRKRPA